MPRGFELVAILFAVVMFFGARRLPEIGGALGKSINAFKKEVTPTDEPVSKEVSVTPTTTGE